MKDDRPDRILVETGLLDWRDICYGANGPMRSSEVGRMPKRAWSSLDRCESGSKRRSVPGLPVLVFNFSPAQLDPALFPV